jgi:CheY-like chemotaxis protein
MQLLDRVRPQVLVSNCAIDDADACSLIRRVRAIETQHNRRIPTVALPARVGAGRLMNHLVAGFQVHVPEPPTPHELVSLIGKLGMAGCSRP